MIIGRRTLADAGRWDVVLSQSLHRTQYNRPAHAGTGGCKLDSVQEIQSTGTGVRCILEWRVQAMVLALRSENELLIENGE